MLTPYDEFPVHQTPYPFSRAPAGGYSFDDGYYFGVFSPEREVFLFQGMRVNPNNDMIGGYAGVMFGGTQYTVRFKRPWRQQFATAIGPYSDEFLEPFRTIRLLLGDNESELRFDLRWLATAPAFEEGHHYATSYGRTTTDQTRYSQSGTAAASLCLTVSQMLRSVRVRLASEGSALVEDNEDLRALLDSLVGHLDLDTAAGVRSAVARPATTNYPQLGSLQAEAIDLRRALETCIEALPAGDSPERAAIRVYLGRYLERQAAWMADAFTGPRR